MIPKIISVILGNPKALGAGALVVILLGGWLGIKSLNTKLDNARAERDLAEAKIVQWELRYDRWARDSTKTYGDLASLNAQVDSFEIASVRHLAESAARARIQQQQINDLRNELENLPVGTDSVATQLGF